METAPARHIKAILTNTWVTPKFTPHWRAFYAPVPPVGAGQDHVQASLSLDNLPSQQGQMLELSPLQRPFLWLRAQTPPQSAFKAGVTRVTYEATLYSRHISPGPPTAPVPGISASEQELNLRASETIDDMAQPFQHWLDAHDLRRPNSERDLAFAFRVYQTIRRLYHYNYEPAQNRKPSHICMTDHSDCGGLSFLFVAALRANGIPARSLAGRLAKSASKPEDYGQCHVESEFYANGVGWVPVDMSCGVCSSDQDALQDFGNVPGNFLVLHQDTDIVLAPQNLRPHTYSLLQGSLHFASGSGSFDGSQDTETWTVEDLPL